MKAREDLHRAARAFALADDELGDEAEQLEAAAVAFASSRAGSARQQRAPKMTATLGAWLAAWRRLEARLGRAPTLAEVAAENGRALTSAHAAVKRLRALNAIASVD
jgi:hypothetical protein